MFCSLPKLVDWRQGGAVFGSLITFARKSLTTHPVGASSQWIELPYQCLKFNCHKWALSGRGEKRGNGIGARKNAKYFFLNRIRGKRFMDHLCKTILYLTTTSFFKIWPNRFFPSGRSPILHQRLTICFASEYTSGESKAQCQVITCKRWNGNYVLALWEWLFVLLIRKKKFHGRV